MRTHYQHPPRSIGFYLKYLLILLVILLPFPMMMIPITAYFGVHPIIIATLFVIPVVWRLWAIAKSFLEQMVVIEDYRIDKSQDVSAFNYPPPVELDEIILQLEFDDFERLGEITYLMGFSKEAVPTWILSKDGGEIIAHAIINPRAKRAYVMFETKCEHGMVATFYGSPVARIIDKTFHAVSVDGTLAGALAYHINKVEELQPTIGDIIPIISMAQFANSDEPFVDKQLAHLRGGLWLSIAMQFFYHVMLAPIPVIIAVAYMWNLSKFIEVLIAAVPLIIIGYVLLRMLRQIFKPIDPKASATKLHLTLGGNKS